MSARNRVSYCVLLLTPLLMLADTKMAFSDLPSAVQQAAKAQLQGARILGAASERENGRTTYEVETMLNGKSRDLSFDAGGKLLEVEQEVDLSAIPAVARAALQSQAEGGTIRKVESVTSGNAVSYEATVITKSGKHKEIAVNSDGAPHHD